MPCLLLLEVWILGLPPHGHCRKYCHFLFFTPVFHPSSFKSNIYIIKKWQTVLIFFKKRKGHWHRTDPLRILILFLPTFLLFMNIKIQKTTYQLPIYWYQIGSEGSVKGKRLQLTGFSAFIVFTLEGGHSLDAKLFQHLWTCQGVGRRASIIKLIINPLQWHQADGISWKLFMGQMIEITHTYVNMVRERSKTVFITALNKREKLLRCCHKNRSSLPDVCSLPFAMCINGREKLSTQWFSWWDFCQYSVALI